MKTPSWTDSSGWLSYLPAVLASSNFMSFSLFLLWVWCPILLFWAFIGVVSFVSAFEACHLADVSIGKVVRVVLKLLLLPTISSVVTPVSLSFHWCDLGHHVLILLPLILNHIGWNSGFLVGTISRQVSIFFTWVATFGGGFGWTWMCLLTNFLIVFPIQVLIL